MTFEVIVMGCSGGPKENNLSGYLIKPMDKSDYICLDTGSLLNGLEIAHKRGHLGNTLPIDVFQKHIKGYLISHSHLDHVLGLVICSQADKPKPLMGHAVCLDAIRDHLFNGKIWPNYGNEGNNPIGQYHYHRLDPGKKTSIAGTHMSVEMFPLHHARSCPSSAFLIEYEGNYALYFGDTAADQNHQGNEMETIWKRVAPLIKQKKLKGILLECSYPSGLIGPGVDAHLDTNSMMRELQICSKLAGGLEEMKVVVTHQKDENNNREKIAKELTSSNDLGVRFIFPVQGDKIVF